ITVILFVLTLSGFLFLMQNKAPDNRVLAQNQNSQIIQTKNQLNDEISNSRKNIITNTVEKVSPAIVGISVIEIRQYRDPFSSFFNDPFFRQFFGDRGTYSQKVKGLGSGYIISSDGYIVTNDHVAGNASEIKVTLTDTRIFEAKIIGTDTASDICLLKIEGENLPYVELGNSDDVIIGEWVIALGNPFGLFELNDKPTVTVGVISATGMNLEQINERYYLNMIQTDAAINGGNSGGPLVNGLGEVIGMNTIIFTSGNNSGNIGLGFAIPINKVKRIVDELKKYGKIERDFEIGLRIQSIDEGIANYYKLKTTKGVIVTKIYPGTPAEKAGIEVGDIILEVEGYKINSESSIFGVFHEFRTGQEVTLQIVRDNKELTKKMFLERK
ncbi:MAG TPA: trypsin-like peptidase domain-containing protein, partial [Ignavibacteriaceae bacterium]|nr:trypsin-like peptidase domain-containing protein [Ignavibacteriaceae bacterium]